MCKPFAFFMPELCFKHSVDSGEGWRNCLGVILLCMGTSECLFASLTAACFSMLQLVDLRNFKVSACKRILRHRVDLHRNLEARARAAFTPFRKCIHNRKKRTWLSRNFSNDDATLSR